MCWSLEVSLFTGILTYGTVITLFIRNKSSRDIWNGIFLMSVGGMQWIDAALWYVNDYKIENLDDCGTWNYYITWFAYLIICAEPMSQLLGSFYHTKKFNIKLFIIYTFIFCMIPRFGSNKLLSGCEKQRSCTYLTPNKHMLYAFGRNSNNEPKCWREHYIIGEFQGEIPFILRVAFLIGIIYPLSYSNPYMPGIINALIITMTWVVAYFSDAHASVWCLAASLQSLFSLFDPYFFGSDRPCKVVDFNVLTKVKNGEKKKKVLKNLRKESNKLLQNRFTQQKIPKNLDAIIIGSGISGLTTGALLSKKGMRVLVLEQHYRAGGCTHMFDELGESEFDSGIHYVGTIDRVKLLLSFVSTVLIEWYEMGTNNNNIYDVFDLDGKNKDIDCIKYRKGRQNLINELVNKFPEDKENIISYFKFIDKVGSKVTWIYIISKIIPNSFIFNKNGWIYKTFIEPYWKYALLTADQVLGYYFKNNKIKSILGGGQLIDWCLIPERVTWWVCNAMMGYYMDGGFYPKKGSNSIPESIIPIILKNGGNVLCRANVEQILINDKQNKAYGVRLNKTGIEIYADIIISSVGAMTLHNELLPNKYAIKFNEDELEASLGHITGFVTFDGTAEELNLPDYNIHSYQNMNKYDYNINNVQKLFYKDPFKYGDDALCTLTFPSAKDPLYNDKYPNKSNCLLLMEAKWEWFDDKNSGNFGKRSDEYKTFKNRFIDIFKKRLYYYCPKTKGRIVSIDIGTPLTSKHFLNTYKGGSYGLGWTTKRMEHKYTINNNLHAKTKILNLHLTGESTMFGGFAGALFSGYITTANIIGYWELIKLLLTTKRV